MRRAIGNLQLSMVSIGLCVGLWEICNCHEEVVGEIGFEVNGPGLFADGNDHEAQSR